MHAIDLIRKKRDGEELSAEEIRFLAEGAARSFVPEEQLAAWLMAAFLRGLSLAELDALTNAMRFSGETFDPSPLKKFAVDKHSTGGVGDKTSLLVAPIAAAAGLAVPMISGRALGHTGGTLDKLESIPGYRTQLSLREMERVLTEAGASIVGQTKALVPADRVLYSLRDRTSTVESPYLICASIMSKKLAAGLNGLVLDVKTGSGAFLRNKQDALFLAALMVETGERAGTRTAALLTNMDQPLGSFAGNWVEIWESFDLLQGKRNPLNEDLRELSLVLAGWMLYLGGITSTAENGHERAEEILASGAALDVFIKMVAAHGGDISVFTYPEKFHQPAASKDFLSDRSGYLAQIDCTAVGWAVQRLGAGRERAGGPIDPHAGIRMHVKSGSKVEAGHKLCTMFSSDARRFAEPEALLRKALVIADKPGPRQPLVQEIITTENRKEFLKTTNRP
ncbi:MAG TPA: thymidine phosphorylase [Pseudacidobacterium sp.]|nr:thymidine phosphorylase [Pseudacidobacterium sp.]